MCIKIVWEHYYITLLVYKKHYKRVFKINIDTKKYKVLFCDLDSTLIDTISGETFPKGIWDMKLNFDVLDAIKKLNPEYVFIVSNQGGIEKGFVNESSFRRKINYIISSLKEYLGENSFIASRFCTSNDKNHRLRKPHTAMLEDLSESFLPIIYDKIICL